MVSLFSQIFAGKTVLITGHTGFKGSWLALWLKKLGADVIGYSLPPPTQPNLFQAIGLGEKMTHIEGDVTQPEHFESIMAKYQPQFIFHLAAQAYVRESYKVPILTYFTNVMGSSFVLEAMRKNSSVKACLVVTSDKCYDNKEWIYGYRETDPLGGKDPYSSSKACAELVIQAYTHSYFNISEYGKSHHLALASARAGNVIGGGDWGTDRLVPDCVRALSEGKPVIIRSPNSIRPWQYILDPLAGYILLAAMLYRNGAKYCGQWNFGPEDQNIMSVEELTKLVILNWGNGEYRTDKKQHPYEASLLKLDASKAHTLLGWNPVYDIQRTIQKTVQWYSRYYSKAGKENLFEYTLNLIDEFEDVLQSQYELSDA